MLGGLGTKGGITMAGLLGIYLFWTLMMPGRVNMD